MEGIKEYLLSVFCAAIICAIVMRLMGEKGTHAVITKLIAGLFLAFTVVYPMAKIDLRDFSDWTASYSDAASQAAAAGERATKESIAASIKLRTEAYILDKATALNTSLKVEVTLSEDDIPCPKAVRLHGSVSPYAKAQLQTIIAQDLGIAKEYQTWT